MLPNKILVVRLGAIGDVVNALVLATALEDWDPSLEIGWVVHPLARPLVEGHPAVDRVHVWDKKGGLPELWRLLRELRSARYELAVDLQRITKSALLARLSGAPRVLGHDRARAKEASWLWTKERIPTGSPTEHMVEQYLAFARALGVPDPGARHAFPEDPASEGWAETVVAELGAAPVQINLGATKPANRWPAERFGRLARLVTEELGVPVCLTGGPEDRPVADLARAAFGGAPEAGPGVRDLVGETSLPELVALSRRVRAWVGCDTGPMHIAAALKRPVVALFGPADPRRTGPWGQIESVVRVPPPCAPCNRRTCNQERHACMEDITPELVLAALRAELSH